MISLIFAVGLNGELGYKNKMLWHLKNDLINFKNITDGKTVIMGRKTFESMGCKPLKNRFNIVLSRSYENELSDNLFKTNNIKFLINKYKDSKEEVFIIGGAEIYNKFSKYAYRLYATIVNAEFTYADTYYDFSTDKYKLILSQEYFEDGYNDYSYDFYIYQKII